MSVISPATTANIFGETISFRRLGNGRRKILFFHGFPASSAQAYPFNEHLKAFDLEVLCLDRPGYNQTKVRSKNRFAQATEDAMGVIRNLGWSSCEVISVSGGTPFLFAFVQAHPRFVTNVTLVSGLGPIFNPNFSGNVSFQSKLSLKILPNIPELFLKKFLPDPLKLKTGDFNRVRAMLPASPPDQAILQKDFPKLVLGHALKEAFLQGGRGLKGDAKLYVSPWSVDLPDYRGPVSIWHGTDDQILKVSMAKSFSEFLPSAKLHLVEGEGHYSLAFNRIHEILGPGTNS